MSATLPIKGGAPRGERAVPPKDPGKFVYFEAEFGQAVRNGLGVFFVGTKERPDLLMGYK